ncbi:hypothetical protein IG631_11025 [Alternaria alternata]|nr:hypothetical protein IG631_11025 [Alternaria alternata]
MLSCCFRARVKIEKVASVNRLFMIPPGLGNQDTGNKHDVVKRRMLCKSSYISSSLKTAYRKPMMTAHIFISMVYISPRCGVINHVLRMLSAPVPHRRLLPLPPNAARPVSKTIFPRLFVMRIR